MLISTLVLLSLFIVGFLTTYFNFPTKKFTSWFQSSLKNPNPPSSHVNITRHELSESLKKSTSTSTSKSSKTHERDELKSVFATFDKNKDGHITRQELSESLKRIGIPTSERDVGEMVERVDSNGDGLIDFGEFCELFDSVMSREGASEEGELKEAFDVFDGNGDGLITVEELGLVLGSLGMKEGKRLEDCKEMIKKVDVDGDGMISFDEFRSMMKSGGRLVDVS